MSETARDDSEFVRASVEQLLEHLRWLGACSAFFRLHPLLSCFGDSELGPLAEVREGQTVSIDLSLSEELLWNHTRKGHRSTINKCKRIGFEMRVVPYLEYLDDFRTVYRQTMDRVRAGQGYYFDEAYFQGLLALGDQLHMAVIEFEGVVAAALLLFECDGIVQAHLGGTRSDMLNLSPFHLLLHEARLWAKQRGNRVFH